MVLAILTWASTGLENMAEYLLDAATKDPHFD